MKRRFWLLVLGFVAMLASSNHVPMQAQAPIDTSFGTFKVIRGTTLWDLSEKLNGGNGNRWTEIFDANVAAGILDSSKLHFANGTPIVILTTGSTILLKRQAAINAKALVKEVFPSALPVLPTAEAQDLRWVWFVLVVFGVAMAAMTFRRIFPANRSVNEHSLENPVTSGPPMRRGGLTDEAAPNYFQTMASRRSGGEGTTGYVSPDRIRVVNIRRGRGYGIMNVSYAGGRQEDKRLTGETVYKATVEYPDGRQEDMYCLQGCGNDLVFSNTRYGVDSDFRFEDAHTTIFVSPAQPTVARAGNTEVLITEEELTISDSGQTISFGAIDWSLKKGPDGGVVISSEGRADVEFRGGRIYGARLPKSVAPAPEPREVHADNMVD